MTLSLVTAADRYSTPPLVVVDELQSWLWHGLPTNILDPCSVLSMRTCTTPHVLPTNVAVHPKDGSISLAQLAFCPSPPMIHLF